MKHSQKLIIIAGASASGKTKYVEYLSQNLSIPLFCKDTIKELMYTDLQIPMDSASALFGERKERTTSCRLGNWYL